MALAAAFVGHGLMNLPHSPLVLLLCARGALCVCCLAFGTHVYVIYIDALYIIMHTQPQQTAHYPHTVVCHIARGGAAHCVFVLSSYLRCLRNLRGTHTAVK
jgi:hypothetical protein